MSLNISQISIYNMHMFPNRLKLGHKRKDSAGLRPTKLTLAFHERADLNNLENQIEAGPAESTEVIKSTPNIQIVSSRPFQHQGNPMTPFNHASTRPLSQRDYPMIESKISDDSLIAAQEISQYKTKLQESKAKIDECKSTITALSTENDSLKNNKKVLEAELASLNKDYYQREIARLRAESEKYQIQNMTNLHKVQSVLQEKSQLEAANKKKTDEIKNYMKQVQKEKLLVAELKNQMNEKDKTFKFALQQSESSNEMLNINQFQLAERYNKLEKEIGQKNKVIESLTMHNELIANRYKQCEGNVLATRKRYEDMLAEKEAKIISLSNQNKTATQDLQFSIYKLQNQIKALKEDQSTQSIKITKMSLDIKSEQQNVDKVTKIIRLQQQLKQAKLIISAKDGTISQLQNTLKQYFCPQQYNSLDKKLKQSQDKRLTSAKYYEERLYNLQKQNERLKIQKLNVNNVVQMPTQKDGANYFNDVLKRTIDQNTAVKQQLKIKIDENQEIISQMMEVRLKEKKFMNQIEILTKKLQSKQKNIKIELEVQRQKFTNDLQSLKRKMQTLQSRLEYKTSQNKQKDDFIKNTIIGRGKPSDVPFIMAELQRIFLEKQKAQLSKQ